MDRFLALSFKALAIFEDLAALFRVFKADLDGAPISARSVKNFRHEDLAVSDGCFEEQDNNLSKFSLLNSVSARTTWLRNICKKLSLIFLLKLESKIRCTILSIASGLRTNVVWSQLQ